MALLPEVSEMKFILLDIIEIVYDSINWDVIVKYSETCHLRPPYGSAKAVLNGMMVLNY